MTGRLRTVRKILVGAVCILLLSGAAHAGSSQVFVDEKFVSLHHWQPFTFQKIDKHSTYRQVQEEGVPCLLMESDGGASAMLLKKRFNVYKYPKLTWRWKVSNVYAKGDSSNKQGDDYPARIYIMFAYDPEQATMLKQMKYATAKLVYGEYPPDSSLTYIWANKPDTPDVITNSYTDRVMMIPVERGPEKAGTWQEYEVNLLADYQKAFKRNPPKTASLAVMIDSDNTGESARAWIDFIRLSR